MIDQSVGDVMTRSTRTVTPDVTACDVAGLLAEHRIGSVLVVDPETDMPIGIVTESDIMRQVATRADIGTVPVESFMSSDLITISSDECIHAAAALMKEFSIRRLPVMDDGELIGMLTTSDLTHYLPRIRNTILRERNELAG